MGQLIDLTGKRFGHLLVTGRAPDTYTKSGHQKINWFCTCDCGKYTEVMIGNLTSGNVQSCGCGHDGHPTHRETNTRLFNIWEGMKGRCYCTTNDAYENYGGRGIVICDEWKENFIAFKEWAIANGYTEELTIERKDVNENYCPENCCWTTKGEQANNKRNTIRISGKTLKDIVQITGMKYSRLYEHYRKGDLEEWLLKQNITL